MVKFPGFTAATRYVASLVDMAHDPPRWKYLAIYEAETDDPAQALEALKNAASADPNQMPMSDTLDISGIYACFYTPITDRVTAKG